MFAANMRIAVSMMLVLATAAGCEHTKDKNPQKKPTTGSGTASGSAAGKKPDPLTDDTVKTAQGAVQPPTAADLAGYVAKIPGEGSLIATIDTPLGALHCELYGDKAPMTVANFVGLATGQKPWLDPNTNQVQTNKPYYDGIVFHRVIPGFMLQTGDPLGKGYGGPGYQFGSEFGNDLTMDAGALAMANAGPETNGSQFFIMEGSRPDLVGRHTIFGKCKEIELVKQIARIPKQCPDCDPNDPKAAAPATPFAMSKVTISKGKL